jgi:hypothetical protein
MKNAIWIIGIIVCFFHSGVYSNPGDTIWTRTYGGIDNDGANCIQQTIDGGYILAGVTSSFGAGNEDFYLIKSNEHGDALWTKTFGGANGDDALNVQQTTDNGYILVGGTYSFGNGRNIYVVKTDQFGNTLWTRNYGGSGTEKAHAVLQADDGGYLVVGNTTSFGAGGKDFYLIKIDASGVTQWTRVYGNSGRDWPFSVDETDDGGYIIAASVNSAGNINYKLCLMKIDAHGNSIWTRTYRGKSEAAGYFVQQTDDGGFIAAGQTWVTNVNNSDFYLVKTDSNGDSTWTRTYGGSLEEVCNSAPQTSDGGFILAGYTTSFGTGYRDGYLVKTDAAGDTIWTRTYGGTELDRFRSIQQVNDDGFIVAGQTYSFGAGGSDVYLVRIEGESSYSNLSGTVSTSGGGLTGVIVDLVDSNNNLYGSTTTDASGFYHFEDVLSGDYTVSIVTPLGYVADYEYQTVILSGSDLTVDFNLTPVEISGDQRGAGFWKHQVNVYTSGRGNAQMPENEFSEYLGIIGSHFNDNSVNPIDLYSVNQPADHSDSLETASALLSVHGNVPTVDHARRHLMALLLNISSLKLSQQAAVSEDGATASQALTYCYDLITDADGSNDDMAKEIAEQINNNITVAASLIPLSTPNISYKGAIPDDMLPSAFGLFQNFPNPFNAQTTIKYALPKASKIAVEVYDLMGRKVETIFEGLRPAGYHSITWNSDDNSSGVYFYKIQAGEFVDSRKILLIK